MHIYPLKSDPWKITRTCQKILGKSASILRMMLQRQSFLEDMDLGQMSLDADSPTSNISLFLDK